LIFIVRERPWYVRESEEVTDVGQGLGGEAGQVLDADAIGRLPGWADT
jgi:hypothetical protein